jgi:hypothetical protein
VRAAARLLTGWRVDYTNFTSTFVPAQHDTTDKQFSAFYGNTLITGRTGATAGEAELDDFLTMLFNTNELALFICRKLYRFFVYHDISPTIEQTIIQPLAQLFRANNYDIKPVLLTLFKSEHFYDMAHRGAMIKSPADHQIGLFRTLNTPLPPATQLYARYKAGLMFFYIMEAQLLSLGSPPNVAGWPAYYQTPAFTRYWINHTTIMNRNGFVSWMVWGGYTTPAPDNFNVSYDVIAFTQTLDDPSDPSALIDEVIKLFYPLPISAQVKTYLTDILLTGQTNPIYWTNAWNAYIQNPNDQMARSTVLNRLRPFYQAVLEAEEIHLF